MSSINYAIMVYELKMRTTRTHRSINYFRIQFWSWFSILLKRINYTLISYVNNKETKFELVTYYPLHADFLWIDAHNLIRQCYHLSRLPLQFVSYKSHLLCDQLTYSNSKEYMSKFYQRKCYDHSFLNHMFFWITQCDTLSQSMRYHGASIENTNCY